MLGTKMKRLLLALAVLVVVSPLYAKSTSQDCNQTLQNLGACSAGQAEDSGVLIFYWVPQARALKIRDAFADGYEANILCTNKPSENIVRPWDGSVAYIEDGHCTQAQSQTLVPNPVSLSGWVDFRIRLFVRNVVRSHRISEALRSTGETEADKPVEEFEENPDQ